MLENNPGTVKIVHKHFPLKNHKFAMKAAVASEVAAENKKFWEFSKLLYKDYNRLNDEKILEIATKLGFNRDEFKKAMENPKLQNKVQSDFSDGIKVGVNSIPKVFINGRVLKIRTLDGFQDMIDAELKKAATLRKKKSP